MARSSLLEVHRLCWVALMAALIAAGALFHLSIGPVPITIQDLFVTLSGFALGPRHGVYAVALYIFAGAAGLPVFSGGRAGLGHLVGPTGGYFLGFLLLAFCTGVGGRLAIRMRAATDDKSTEEGKLPHGMGVAPTLAALGCALAGLLLLYACGMSWLMVALDFSPAQAFATGVLPFAPIGVAKMLLCVLLWRGLYLRGLLPE